MSIDEARALVRSSVPYQAEAGNMVRAYFRWKQANPNEAKALELYADTWFQGMPAGAPVLKTKMGQGLVGLMPGAAPPPPPPAKPLVGAMVVTAGNLDPQLLRDAGVTHVAVELGVDNNLDLATSRWHGFVKGAFVVSRGNDGEAVLAQLEQGPAIYFAVIDTESHKADMGGQLAWTETLYASLRSKLGPAFPLYNVTFGIHSSPAVVNHDAMRRHNVTPIWEAYDGPGNTLGVQRTALKALSEGWVWPHIAIGDKSLAADAQELGTLGGLGGVWLWAPDNGQAQEDLRAGAAAALKAVLA